MRTFTDKQILYKHMIRAMKKNNYLYWGFQAEFAMFCYERIFALEGLKLKNGWLLGKMEEPDKYIFQ